MRSSDSRKIVTPRYRARVKSISVRVLIAALDDELATVRLMKSAIQSLLCGSARRSDSSATSPISQISVKLITLEMTREGLHAHVSRSYFNLGWRADENHAEAWRIHFVNKLRIHSLTHTRARARTHTNTNTHKHKHKHKTHTNTHKHTHTKHTQNIHKHTHKTHTKHTQTHTQPQIHTHARD